MPVAVSSKRSLHHMKILMSQLIAMFCNIDDVCKWFEPVLMEWTRLCRKFACVEDMT